MMRGAHILLCLAVTCALGALVATKGVVAQQRGIMFAEAGVHFFLPIGFELSSTEVRGWDGPVQLVLFEPQGGVVAGEPSSAFLALQVHDYEIQPRAALERTVNELTTTFASTGGIEIEEAELMLGGAMREAVELRFSVADVPMRVTVAGIRDGDLTIVAVVQGKPDELEVLDAVFLQILESIGAGPAPAVSPTGSGEGTGL